MSTTELPTPMIANNRRAVSVRAASAQTASGAPHVEIPIASER
jgi:hypothetical protein